LGWRRVQRERAVPRRTDRLGRCEHGPWSRQHLRDGSRSTAGNGGPDPRGCNNVEPWTTTIRGLGTYTVPKVDVLVSATVRSASPQEITAIWQVNTATTITPILGHAPAGSTATTNITLTDPDHRIFADSRRTTVDMRFAKIVRFAGRRADVGIDLNNALNTNYATTYSGTFLQGTDQPNVVRPGGFLTPTAIYNPRFVRFNFTLNF
jgi:hypothetical protein